VLIHITLVDALGRPQASQLDDQYILLADAATTADLHCHLVSVCGVVPVDITARIAYDERRRLRVPWWGRR